MKKRTKQHIIGILVIVALAVIFMPMLIKNSGFSLMNLTLSTTIPRQPKSPQINFIQGNAQQIDLDKKNNLAEDIPGRLKSAMQNQILQPVWLVKAAELKEKPTADELVQQLRQQSFAAFVREIKQNYVVFVGPKLSKSGAEAIAAQLREKFKLSPQILEQK